MDGYTIEYILPQNDNLPAKWREALRPEWQRVQESVGLRLAPFCYVKFKVFAQNKNGRRFRVEWTEVVIYWSVRTAFL